MTLTDRSFDKETGAIHPAGRLWSHAELARFLDLPESSLHQMNRNGVGPRSFKIGRLRRYAEQDVLVWLDSRASRPRAEA
jgi:predicted DNA-binding transcriptional regulator AlpA